MVPGLSLPPDGHDYTDYDRCGHDDPEKILKYAFQTSSFPEEWTLSLP